MTSTALHHLNPFDAAKRQYAEVPVTASPKVSTVPDNTPQSATPSVTRGSKAMDITALAQHLAQVERTEPGQFWENDSAVPHNTPAPAVQSPVLSTQHGYSADDLRDRLDNLPANYFQGHYFAHTPSNASSVKLGGESSGSPLKSATSANNDNREVDFYYESPKPVVPLLASRLSAPQLQQIPFAGASPAASSASNRNRNDSPSRAPRSHGAPASLSEGVPEHSDWGEEVEEDVRKALAKLYNLARDDWQKNPESAVSEHFKARLMHIAKSHSPIAGSFALPLLNLIDFPNDNLLESMMEQVDRLVRQVMPTSGGVNTDHGQSDLEGYPPERTGEGPDNDQIMRNCEQAAVLYKEMMHFQGKANRVLEAADGLDRVAEQVGYIQTQLETLVRVLNRDDQARIINQ